MEFKHLSDDSEYDARFEKLIASAKDLNNDTAESFEKKCRSLKENEKLYEIFIDANLTDENLSKINNTITKLVRYRAKYAVCGIPIYIVPSLLNTYRNTYKIVFEVSPAVSKSDLLADELREREKLSFKILSELQSIIDDTCDFDRLLILKSVMSNGTPFRYFPSFATSDVLMRIPDAEWYTKDLTVDIQDLLLQNAVNVLTRLILTKLEQGDSYENQLNISLEKFSGAIKSEINSLANGFESSYRWKGLNGMTTARLKRVHAIAALSEMVSTPEFINKLIENLSERKQVYDLVDVPNGTGTPFKSIVSNEIYKTLERTDFLISEIIPFKNYTLSSKITFEASKEILDIIRRGNTIDKNSIKVYNSDFSEIGNEPTIEVETPKGIVQLIRPERHLKYEYTSEYKIAVSNLGM
jgi:hypothetical protein